MSWATKRQLKYFIIFAIFVAFIIFLVILPMFFEDVTCFDGKKNGDERGVDCGGSCLLMCKSDITEPVVLWSRAFSILENNYNIVALIENRNKNSGVALASYEFKMYDTENKLLGSRQGQTFIPPNQQFAVLESRFHSGQSKIKTVTFEFIEPLVWIKKEPTLQVLKITAENINFYTNPDNSSLSAIIENNSIYDIPEFEVIAILYDTNRNAINVSKTSRGKLLSGSKSPVVFTWPEALSTLPVIKDVLISIDPFSVSF
jgi:hypothetical protein